MEAPLLLSLANARLNARASVQALWVSPRALCLAWAPERKHGLESGFCWILLLNPAPEIWLLHEKDPAAQLLKAESKLELTRRWGHELKGASLERVEGDPRERWLGLIFRRRAITGRIELTRLAFQAIPGRSGIRLDGLDLNQTRLGMGQPFPAAQPDPQATTASLTRWQERFGKNLEAALQGQLPEVMDGSGSIFERHHAWSLQRAEKLLLAPKQNAKNAKLTREYQKLLKYGQALGQDRAKHEKGLILRDKANRISAELYRLKGLQGQVTLLDGTSIDLPTGLRCEVAVQKWFSAIKKAERGLARLSELENQYQRNRQTMETQLGMNAPSNPPQESSHPAMNPESPKQSETKTPAAETASPKAKTQATQKPGARSDGKGKAYREIKIEDWDVLIGKGDQDNDNLTFKVADGLDFWLHVAGVPGSHVIIRNPDRISEPPREVLERAAQLAAFYSKAKDGGKVEVHWCRVADVSKPRGFAPGKVMLKSFKGIRVYPKA